MFPSPCPDYSERVMTAQDQRQPTSAAALDEYAQFVSPGKIEFFRSAGIEFAMGRREGARIWNLEGDKELIDCHCNGGVFNLGHRNPAVIAALERAVQSFDIGNHHLPSGPRARTARKLAQCTPGDLQYSVFGVSGGEAIDCAIKVARKATGRRGVVSASGGYHGHTGLALAAGESKWSQPFLSDSPDFRRAPLNDLDAMDDALTDDVAAVVLETILATQGMVVPDGEYLRGVKALCQERGTVYIADEVQTGLGRTGKLWGIEHYDVVPDILVTGKGLSGGIYPITATILTPAMMAVFDDDPFLHISTFGGAEAGCVVAETVLDITTDPSFLKRVVAVSQELDDGLRRLQRKFPEIIAEIRGMGMFLGIRMAHELLGQVMVKTCYEAGLLCVYAAHDTSVVQFLPPLIADSDLAGEILERLGKAVELAASLAG